MNAYDNPMEFVQAVSEEASELSRYVGNVSDFFYDGGPSYQAQELANTEEALRRAMALILSLTELKVTQQRYLAEKIEERQSA